MDLDFCFDNEHRLLQDSAREVSESRVKPFLASFPEESLPREAIVELLSILRPLGILGARLPLEVGGDGLSNVQLGIIYEQLPAEAAMIATTNAQAAVRIYDGGSDAIRARYLPGLMSGRLLGASAISEPDTGSDLSAIKTRAERDGASYRITGTKLWSSGALAADVLLVAASLGTDERKRSVIGGFVVDRVTPGMEIHDIKMLGLERQSICEVSFSGCSVPADNLVGSADDGMSILNRSWLSQRALVGLIAVRLADDALSASISYARERVQFGRPIGTFQLVQAILVEMKTLVDTSRFLCYRALSRLDSQKNARFESSVAKYYATEAAVKVTGMAIQIHGALGLSREMGLEKLYRDARMLPAPDGTTEIQKLIAGRELLGLSAIRD